MRRDVQLYIEKSEQFYSSVGEENLVTDGNFVNGTTEWTETSGVSYVIGQANVAVTSAAQAVNDSKLESAVRSESGG